MFFHFVCLLLVAVALGCGITQYTTNIGAEVTDIIVSTSSGVQLSVSIDANEDNRQALVSFHGNSVASSVVGTSTDGTTFTMSIQASEPTDPPSSANSMIFFSDTSKTVAGNVFDCIDFYSPNNDLVGTLMILCLFACYRSHLDGFDFVRHRSGSVSRPGDSDSERPVCLGNRFRVGFFRYSALQSPSMGF